MEPGQCLVDVLFGTFCVRLHELVAGLDLVQNMSSLRQIGLGKVSFPRSVTWVHWICEIIFYGIRVMLSAGLEDLCEVVTADSRSIVCVWAT
jgi:hypothetical protein